MKAGATCEACDWGLTITEPDPGQSLFGTLAWYMARHEGTHPRAKNPTSIDWRRTG